MQREDHALRGRVVTRRRAVVEFLGDLLENALDLAPRFGLRGLQQALLHHRGRAHQKIAKQMRRDVGPLPDLFRKIAVAFRALDQRGEAALGQPGGLIVGDVVHHLGVAAADQNVGDGLADALAAGDDGQMRLTLGLGQFDQLGFLQPDRLREHRTGHRDIVVVRKLAHQLHRRVRQRRQRLRHFGARLGLDLDDQPA